MASPISPRRIGISLAGRHTDDGLRDNVEVSGFAFGGQTWYTNPGATDSNGDGLGDIVGGESMPAGTCAPRRSIPMATGIPDLFDADNDNDGVPDHRIWRPLPAAQPCIMPTPPVGDQGLTAGKPTFVEFQLHPQDETTLVCLQRTRLAARRCRPGAMWTARAMPTLPPPPDAPPNRAETSSDESAADVGDPHSGDGA